MNWLILSMEGGKWLGLRPGESNLGPSAFVGTDGGLFLFALQLQGEGRMSALQTYATRCSADATITMLAPVLIGNGTPEQWGLSFDVCNRCSMVDPFTPLEANSPIARHLSKEFIRFKSSIDECFVRTDVPGMILLSRRLASGRVINVDTLNGNMLLPFQDKTVACGMAHIDMDTTNNEPGNLARVDEVVARTLLLSFPDEPAGTPMSPRHVRVIILVVRLLRVASVRGEAGFMCVS